jgi:hypothetical protein
LLDRKRLGVLLPVAATMDLTFAVPIRINERHVADVSFMRASVVVDGSRAAAVAADDSQDVVGNDPSRANMERGVWETEPLAGHL